LLQPGRECVRDRDRAPDQRHPDRGQYRLLPQRRDRSRQRGARQRHRLQLRRRDVGAELSQHQLVDGRLLPT
jgi:hypothetical protein